MYRTVRRTKKLPVVVEEIGRRTLAADALPAQRQVKCKVPGHRISGGHAFLPGGTTVALAKLSHNSGKAFCDFVYLYEL